MSRPAAPPAPLEEHDPERARALKAKIRDRVSDVRRHLIALRTAMADFGENFDLDAFQAAYDSEDPVALNRVKSVERGVDQLYNYMAELTAFGLELAEVRARGDELNARRDVQALQRIGVIGHARATPRTPTRATAIARPRVRHRHRRTGPRRPHDSSPRSSSPITTGTAAGSAADSACSRRHSARSGRPASECEVGGVASTPGRPPPLVLQAAMMLARNSPESRDRPT